MDTKKVFFFLDGKASFALTGKEILEMDEDPDLQEFVRKGEIGEILSGINVNGIDVKRII